ncbi:aldo/keto reductase [Caballeronia sp. LZ062]|uniref:aldo/keto reductase n=1 Tax=unclassified Caballeronia TaxID=2646786 RepID=UPI00285F5DD6|nr:MULTISPECIES: aldo/keto reductase [unclassified Caballeronia]MDR5857469.1 aldo/keto reductase [Caballeronia sp. LZ050]MDR5869020.1 aldo/keto reductase [Caballeronia sp. LZ062]
MRPPKTWRTPGRRDFLLASAAALLTVPAARAWAADAPIEPMHKRRIPSTGEALPVVGCGTWRTFDVGDDAARRRELAEVLRVLFAAGGSVIDSSPMYGTSEAVAGALLTELHARDKAFIATKVWTEGREEGIAQMQQSMQRLAAPRIDLMQIHNLLDWRTQLATLRDWKAAGRVRYIGITHYTSSAFGQVEAVLRAERVDFVQINYAANDRDAEARLLPLAADRGVAVIVNQPFGGGSLLAELRGRPLPPFAAELGCTSWAQLLLKFVLGNPAVTCVIPGTGRREYMVDNVHAGIGVYPDAALRRRIEEAVA